MLVLFNALPRNRGVLISHCNPSLLGVRLFKIRVFFGDTNNYTAYFTMKSTLYLSSIILGRVVIQFKYIVILHLVAEFLKISAGIVSQTVELFPLKLFSLSCEFNDSRLNWDNTLLHANFFSCVSFSSKNYHTLGWVDCYYEPLSHRLHDR